MTQIPKHYYLLRLSFLGFRFQGWQQQPGVKSVEGMVQKTLSFVLPGRSFKLLGAGRTDARVSALDFVSQFILNGTPLEDLDAFRDEINKNLPADLKLMSVTSVSKDFNAIRDSIAKTYRYYFSFGTKPHPFCAPFLGYFPGLLDIERMKKAASLFVGTHNFKGFIVQPGPSSQLIRTITRCELAINAVLSASFFPEKTYYLDVTGPGFGRNQVRLMVSALVAVGRDEYHEESLKNTLLTGESTGIKHIAPASGLHLMGIQMELPS